MERFDKPRPHVREWRSDFRGPAGEASPKEILAVECGPKGCKSFVCHQRDPHDSWSEKRGVLVRGKWMKTSRHSRGIIVLAEIFGCEGGVLLEIGDRDICDCAAVLHG